MIHHGGPWRNLADVHYATHKWVAWFRLEPLGDVPQAEYEAQFDRVGTATSARWGTQLTGVHPETLTEPLFMR